MICEFARCTEYCGTFAGNALIDIGGCTVRCAMAGDFIKASDCPKDGTRTKGGAE